MTYKILYSACLILLFNSCVSPPNEYTQLPPGQWRGILKLSDPEQKTVQGSEDMGSQQDYFELPFNVETTYEDGNLSVYLINGAERLQVEQVHYGRDKSTAKDTLLLDMSAFDTKMEGFYEGNYIEGEWIVNYKDGYSIPFIMTYGQEHRFKLNEQANTTDFDGNWKMIFDYDGDPYPGVAELTQKGGQLAGTILTETGDYRYLEGDAFGDKMRLSVFDGAHAFLFSGSLDNDTIYGEFRSGKHYKSRWYAVKEATTLADPDDMTQSTTTEPVELSYVTSSGQDFKLSEQPDSKLTIINIMGTWCPNCRDEINYLKELKSKPGYEDVQILSLAFEKYKDQSRALTQLERYKASMGMDWPILLGGYADKKANSEALTFIDRLYSYPTMIILDDERKVRHIHTGFSGPATSKYAEFKEEMARILSEIINEAE